MIEQIFPAVRSTIVLNGVAAWNTLIPYMKASPCLIAADGAAQTLDNLGVTPHHIVGDGDSCPRDKWLDLYELVEEQTTTDFQKALNFAKSRNAFPALIMGIQGGELDHTWGNFYLFMQARELGPIFFLDAQELGGMPLMKMGTALFDETFYGESALGTKISLLPFPSLLATSQGWKWPLQKTRLTQDKELSLRNETRLKRWRVTVRGKGALIWELAC
ncbi:MAG: thiamine diphosphokinase [Chlamydiota bacterium]